MHKNPTLEELSDDSEELLALSAARRRRRRWLIGLGLLLFIALMATAWSVWQHQQRVASVPEHIEQALAYRAQDNLHEAVAELKSALEIQPDDADVRLELAQIYLDLDDGLSAEKEFRRVIALGRSSSAIELGLLYAKLLKGEFDEVLKHLEWLDSTDLQALMLKGEALLGLNRLDEAEAAFNAVLDEDTTLLRALQGAAQVNLDKGTLEAANKHVDAALRVSDTDVRTWLIKSDIAFASLEYDVAVDAAKRVLAIQDDHIGATFRVVQSLLQLNRSDTAEPHIAKLELAQPESPTVHFYRGIAASQQDDLQRAKDAFQTAVNLSPDHEKSLFQLASIHYQEKEFAKAQDAIEQVLKIAPGHAPSTKLLVSILIARRHYPEAVDTLRLAIEQAPMDTQLVSLLSNTYAIMGDFDSSSRLLKQAAKLVSTQAAPPTQSKTRTTGSAWEDAAPRQPADDTEKNLESVRNELLLGAVFIERKDYAAAIDTAKAVATKLPDSPLPSYLLGIAYESLKDIKQAVNDYEHALEIDPSFTAAVFRLANLEVKAGDVAGARARYRSALAKNPHHPELLGALAGMALESGDKDTWVQLLEESRQHNPTDIRSRLELAQFFLGAQPGKALAIAEEALGIEPKSQATVLLMAKAELANGKLESALRRLSALAESFPESADVHFTHGYAHELMGKFDLASTSYATALDRDREHFDARTGLGRMELHQGRASTALETAHGAQQTHPGRAEGYVLEGDAHRLNGKPALAIPAYEAALDRLNDAGIVVSLSSAYWDMGDQKRAEQGLRDWLAKHPTDARIRKELAQIGLLTGDIPLAIGQYEQVIENAPRDYEALNNLAYLYHRAGDSRALALADRAHELAPGNLDIKDTYGWILTETGHLDKGLSILQAIVEQSPDNPDYRLHLAEALIKAGEHLEARKTLIPIMKREGDSPHKQRARKLLGLDS